jgi:hypothetical protein
MDPHPEPEVGYFCVVAAVVRKIWYIAAFSVSQKLDRSSDLEPQSSCRLGYLG